MVRPYDVTGIAYQSGLPIWRHSGIAYQSCPPIWRHSGIAYQRGPPIWRHSGTAYQSGPFIGRHSGIAYQSAVLSRRGLTGSGWHRIETMRCSRTLMRSDFYGLINHGEELHGSNHWNPRTRFSRWPSWRWTVYRWVWIIALWFKAELSRLLKVEQNLQTVTMLRRCLEMVTVSNRTRQSRFYTLQGKAELLGLLQWVLDAEAGLPLEIFTGQFCKSHSVISYTHLRKFTSFHNGTVREMHEYRETTLFHNLNENIPSNITYSAVERIAPGMRCLTKIFLHKKFEN